MPDNQFKINSSPYIKPAETVKINETLQRNLTGAGFEALLKQQLDKNAKSAPLQFSKHAQERVAQRGIELSQELLDNITSAVQKARVKGAKDLAIIGEKSTFIVNVTNNIVVTTMSGSEMKENIFTNIDSAVII